MTEQTTNRETENSKIGFGSTTRVAPGGLYKSEKVMNRQLIFILLVFVICTACQSKKSFAQQSEKFEKDLIVSKALSDLVRREKKGNQSTFIEDVFKSRIHGGPDDEMMPDYLHKKVDEAFVEWDKKYDELKNPEDIRAYQKRMKRFFFEQLGEMPDKTALNPKITGKVQMEGYRIEHVIFESRPGFYVTGNMFLPDETRFKAPYPGILIPCGHTSKGKGSQIYQKAAALCALNGMAAFVFDPIGQGERQQKIFHRIKGNSYTHNMIGVPAILLGQNTASIEVWDGIRAIDYLQSRKDIDPKRIGCMGSSGGGTQTAYLMALDERIVAASPICYIASFRCNPKRLGRLLMGCAEQWIHNQIAYGLDHADYIMMRAPKPTLVCAARRDKYFPIKATRTSYGYAKRLYSRMNRADAMDLVEADTRHGYSRILREASVSFMSRWLLNKEVHVSEPENLKVLEGKQIRCTLKGQVNYMEGAKTAFDVWRDLEKIYAGKRQELWKNKMDLNNIRKVVGIRSLRELPKAGVKQIGQKIETEEYILTRFLITPEPGITLPTLVLSPKTTKPSRTVICVHEMGKAAMAKDAARFVAEGTQVVAVDLRGFGESQMNRKGWSIQDVAAKGGFEYIVAYLLGKSFVGMRSEDLLQITVALREGRLGIKAGQIDLLAEGSSATVAALHAAALEEDMYHKVTLKKGLHTWKNVVNKGDSKNQLMNTVHGALRLYDLDNLYDLLGDKLTLIEPLDAHQKKWSSSTK